jgi:hypothetical protein
MGHASSNNKKCPHYKPKHVTPQMAKTPTDNSVAAASKSSSDDLVSFPDSADFSILNKAINLDKPIKDMYHEELMKIQQGDILMTDHSPNAPSVTIQTPNSDDSVTIQTPAAACTVVPNNCPSVSKPRAISDKDSTKRH